ncbi:hypothetical protein ACFVIM_23835 [Streptomyces sp. NPDC057638]|uniref:hypothetical protein n=1 Tax=Streptomyces sp. NPDC057638 TaxID=3346190 RepID=UPI0036A83FAC
MRQITRGVVAVLAFGTVGAVLPTAVASATPTGTSSVNSPAAVTAPSTPAAGPAQAGRFWIYGENDYNGYRKSYNTTDKWFRNDEWDGTRISVDNGTNSVWNRTNRTGVLWTIGSSTGAGCAGDGLVFPAGSYSWNLGRYNNTASCLVLL